MIPQGREGFSRTEQPFQSAVQCAAASALCKWTAIEPRQFKRPQTQVCDCCAACQLQYTGCRQSQAQA